MSQPTYFQSVQNKCAPAPQFAKKMGLYIAGKKWLLISVVVFSKVNNNIQTNTGYELTWGSESLGIGTYKFPLQVYFGEEDVLKKVFY